MGFFDHLGLPVLDCEASRDWYRSTLGLEIEFEALERRTVALRDAKDFALFLYESRDDRIGSVGIWYQVADVEAAYVGLRESGIDFVHEPKSTPWGYGAELRDPNGYRIYLWDEVTMKANQAGAT